MIRIDDELICHLAVEVGFLVKVEVVKRGIDVINFIVELIDDYSFEKSCSNVTCEAKYAKLLH